MLRAGSLYADDTPVEKMREVCSCTWLAGWLRGLGRWLGRGPRRAMRAAAWTEQETDCGCGGGCGGRGACRPRYALGAALGLQ